MVGDPEMRSGHPVTQRGRRVRKYTGSLQHQMADWNLHLILMDGSPSCPLDLVCGGCNTELNCQGTSVVRLVDALREARYENQIALCRKFE